MSVGEALSTCFRKYATSEGRAQPAEFWWSALFALLVGIGFYFMLSLEIDPPGTSSRLSGILDLASILAFGGIIIPTFAVTARRLHDIGKPGTIGLLYLVPIVGPIVLWVMLAAPGDRGPNQYGPPPRSASGKASARKAARF